MKLVKKNTIYSRVGAVLLAVTLMFSSTGFETFAESINLPEEISIEEASEMVKVEVPDSLSSEETVISEEALTEVINEEFTPVEESLTEEPLPKTEISSEEETISEEIIVEESSLEEVSEEAATDELNSEETLLEEDTENTDELSESVDTELSETEEADEEETDKEIEETEAVESEEIVEVELEESKTVDGVKVTVSADKGVFPEGAYIEVKKVSGFTEAEALEAVDELRDESKNVAATYTFDITVYDKDGNEIEPDNEKGSVKVTFEMVEASNSNLDVDVYHVEESNNSFEATKLEDVEIIGDEITAGTDGFSIYTVEFTYNDLCYVLDGGKKVEVTNIASTVGLDVSAGISDVSTSDSSYIKVTTNNNLFYIESLSNFADKDEYIEVTVDGYKYKILMSVRYQVVSTVKLSEEKLNFTNGIQSSTGYFMGTSTAVSNNTTVHLNAGESVTVKYANAYKYLGGAVYDVYVKITPRTDTGPKNKWRSEVSASSSNGYYIRIQPLESSNSANDFDYEVWLQNGNDVVTDLALVGGSCFTSSKEGARPWSDNGMIYTNVTSTLAWNTDKEGVYPKDSNSDKANYYILGHGFDGNGHIRGGYFSTGGYCEIVLGYLSRTITLQINNEPIKVECSDGFPIGEKGADEINKNAPTNCTGWTANHDVNLDGGDVIPANTRIPKDRIKDIVVDENIVNNGTTNFTLTPITTPTYTVSFDLNYSGAPQNPDSITIFKGDKYGTLPAPTRTGYDFEGWYTAKENGTKVTATSFLVSDSNHTLYAHWKAQQFTLSFDSNAAGVTAPGSITKDYGTQYGDLPAPGSREGYDFEGWYSAKENGTKAQSTDTFTDNKTLYAHWTPNTYEVTFDGKGATVTPDSKDVTYDSTYGDLPTPTRKGYTFDGWFTEENGGSEITKDTTVSITSAQTIYAHWTPVSLKVNFDPNEGAVSETSRDITFDAPYGALPVPTYIGHTFDGWFTEKTGGTKVLSDTLVSKETEHTLYAHWNDNNVTAGLGNYVFGGTTLPDPTNTLTPGELATNPTIKYYYTTTNTTTGGTEWTGMTTETLPAGEYYIYAVITGTDGTEYITPASPFTVQKADSSCTPPEGLNSTYTGNPQELLVTAGTATGGTMMYSLTYSADGSGYAASIPEKTNAGVYDVFYMVKGDSNHNDYIAPASVKAYINKADCTVVPPVDKGNIYTGLPLELVEAATATGGEVWYSLDGTNYSKDIPTGVYVGEYTVYYKVVPDENHNGIDPQSVTVTVSKNVRAEIKASMENYIYGQKTDIPKPSLDVTPLENPTITYYYYPAGHPEDKAEWDDSFDSKTLNSGDYCIYAYIGASENYAPYTTEPVNFIIAKGVYVITPPTAEYIYGEKIETHDPADGKAVAEDSSATEITGTFTWVDNEKEKLPKVSDSIENDGTVFKVVFTPSDAFIKNYDSKECDAQITVKSKVASPSELNMKLEKKDDSYDVTENMLGEVDPVLTPGVDYDVEVKKYPNKDKDGNITDYDYEIVYTFKGNYSGTISKKVNLPVPKPNPEGENLQSSIMARVDREQDVIDAYNPKMKAPDYEQAKNIVLNDFAKYEDTDSASRDIAAKLADPLTAKDVIFSANVVIEVTKPVLGEGEFKDDKPIADAYIFENIEDAGKNTEYIDISMFTTYKLTDSVDTSKVFEADRNRIRDTGDDEEVITIDIPDSLRVYPSDIDRTFFIVRVHEGIAQILDSVVENGRITFRTSKFSTYAIAYSDKKKASPAPAPTPAPTPAPAPAPAPEPSPEEEPKVLPKGGQVAPQTNDTTNNAGFIGMIISGLALLFTGRKKK